MNKTFFTAFYGEMCPKLVRFIRSHHLAPHLAEDLAHDTLLTLWQKNLPTPDGEVEEGRLRSFAYCVATGHVRNTQRKTVGEMRLVARLGETTRESGSTGLYGAGGADFPGELTSLMAALSSADRQILSLAMVGFGPADTAEFLDITPKAASTRLRRAKDRARAELSGSRLVSGQLLNHRPRNAQTTVGLRLGTTQPGPPSD